MLLDGGLALWAAQPIYRRVWEHAFLGNLFNVYTLKLTLVHSETDIAIMDS